MSEEQKKIKKAVALKYDKAKFKAPHVAAKGHGVVAERILEIAKENEIAIHSDADLIEILDKVEIEQEIPLEIYTVVAEIFAYIYKINNKKQFKG